MKKLVLFLVMASTISPSAMATHSWGGYHWARTTTSFDLAVINSTTSDWDGYVAQATSDWSVSTVLNMVEDTNGDTSSKTRRQCSAPTGMVRICNLAYGNNGWLGIAGISIDSRGHIVSGYTKLNDTYFDPGYAGGYYYNDLWRQAVTCQELGHDIGLGHQDENFNNDPLYTCMDYQDPPYAYPNAHDYDELGIIYGHTDTYDSYAGAPVAGGGGGGGACNSPVGKGCNKSPPVSNGDIGWGMSLGRRGNSETFLRIDPDGTRHLTHVTWTKEYVEKLEHSEH